MEVSHVSSILVALTIYALAVPIPGPSMVIISRMGVTSGHQARAAAFGTTFGVVIYAVATLLGLSTLLTALPWMLTLIQAVGGSYLAYLGLMLIRAHIKNRNTEMEGTRDQIAAERQPISKAFLKGFYVSIGNPKMAAFFFGLFAPVAGNSGNRVAQLTILIGVIIIDLVYHQALAQVVSLASRSFAQRSVRKWLDAVTGGLMAIFGVGLLVNAITEI